MVRVAVRFNCEYRLLAYSVVEQKVDMRSGVQRISSFFIRQQRHITQELSQRLMANNTQMAELGVLLNYLLQHCVGEIFRIILRNAFMLLQVCQSSLGVLVIKQIEN